jgi:hypothetical protein
VTESKYAHLIERENGRIYISNKDISTYLSTHEPKRDLKKPSPEYVTIRSIAHNDNALYRRLLKCAKLGKITTVKEGNRYYVLPQDVEQFIANN